MEELQELKKKYWKIIAETRKSGRISENVIRKEEEYWACFPPEVVKEALSIHIKNCRGYRENYTRGIMRNLKRMLDEKGTVKKQNSFMNFNQREYDYEKLERELLGLE